jgi:TRAP-type C4-dicarboxylate transport system permease small subunit
VSGAAALDIDGAATRADTVLTGLSACFGRLNALILLACMAALLGAAFILTYGVGARYFFHLSTEWQDEAAVFLLVGASFLSCASVQQQRGHIGIDAFAALLGARANLLRLCLVDLAGALFCAFFSYKSWTLFHEAWRDGQTTTSSWGPPLSVPYACMALGMTLLCLQLLLQFALACQCARSARAPGSAP